MCWAGSTWRAIVVSAAAPARSWAGRSAYPTGSIGWKSSSTEDRWEMPGFPCRVPTSASIFRRLAFADSRSNCAPGRCRRMPTKCRLASSPISFPARPAPLRRGNSASSRVGTSMRQRHLSEALARAEQGPSMEERSESRALPTTWATAGRSSFCRSCCVGLPRAAASIAPFALRQTAPWDASWRRSATLSRFHRSLRRQALRATTSR